MALGDPSWFAGRASPFLAALTAHVDTPVGSRVLALFQAMMRWQGGCGRLSGVFVRVCIGCGVGVGGRRGLFHAALVRCASLTSVASPGVCATHNTHASAQTAHPPTPTHVRITRRRAGAGSEGEGAAAQEQPEWAQCMDDLGKTNEICVEALSR